jgi:hypothetical protein
LELFNGEGAAEIDNVGGHPIGQPRLIETVRLAYRPRRLPDAGCHLFGHPGGMKSRPWLSAKRNLQK